MKRTLIAPTVVALVTGAYGGDDGGKEAVAAPARTVDVDMVDVAFGPAVLTAEPDERIRFVVHNRGQAVRDAFIGDAAAQAEHEQEMREAERAAMEAVTAAAATIKPSPAGGWRSWTAGCWLL